MSVDIIKFDGQHKFAFHCDFCAKSEADVACLIASANGSHICNECVVIAADIIVEKLDEAGK